MRTRGAAATGVVTLRAEEQGKHWMEGDPFATLMITHIRRNLPFGSRSEHGVQEETRPQFPAITPQPHIARMVSAQSWTMRHIPSLHSSI